MLTSVAHVPTTSADRYAKQLCNHANHMGARAEWTPPDGLVEFPHGGTCRLTTSADELVLTLQAATPDQLATMQAILTADLERFGQRHDLTVTWYA